jgi:uncharacterized damage-inducible protein DinB
MKTTVLTPGEFAPNYQAYIDAFGEGDLFEEFEISIHEFIRFVQEVPLGKHDFRYAEGKWSLKDIIQHLIDAERIFAYRALRIARTDQTPLPGFDENQYVPVANADHRHLKSLLEEYAAVRHATLLLFKSFSDDDLKRLGTASNVGISVRALGFIIVGHLKHHQRIFRERYLYSE